MPVFDALRRACASHAKWQNGEIKASVIGIINRIETEAEDVGFSVEDSTEKQTQDLLDLLEETETDTDQKENELTEVLEDDEYDEDDDDDIPNEEDEEDDE